MGGQHSTRGLARLRRDTQGLANDASRNLDERTGTSCNQGKRNLIGQTVKLHSGGNWAGKEYINYLQDLSRSVSNYISRMQVVFLVLISTYVWNQGQVSPLVGENQPLRSKFPSKEIRRWQEGGKGMFARRIGNLLQAFSCVPRVAQIMEMDSCFAEVPVLADGKVQFVDV